MGVSPSAFRKWLKGEADPSRERLVALAEIAQVEIAWLARGEGPEPDFLRSGRRFPSMENGNGASGMDLPGFSLMPSDGVDHESADGHHGFVGFRHDWIRDSLRVEPSVLIMEIAVGDAMAPTVVHGDLLLIDGSDTGLRQDGLYALRISGGIMVRRVQRLHDGSVALIADNPAYVPDSIPFERVQTLGIAGRILWIGGTP